MVEYECEYNKCVKIWRLSIIQNKKGYKIEWIERWIKRLMSKRWKIMKESQFKDDKIIEE